MTTTTTATATIPAGATVTNTYRGGQGCACGCTGTYSTKPTAVKQRTKMINDAIDAGEYVELLTFNNGNKCYSFEYYTPAGAPKAVRVYTD